MSKNKTEKIAYNSFKSVWPPNIKDQIDFVVKRFGYENHGQVSRKIRLIRKRYDEPEMNPDEINKAIAYMSTEEFVKNVKPASVRSRNSKKYVNSVNSMWARSRSRSRSRHKKECPKSVLDTKIPYPKGDPGYGKTISVTDALKGCNDQQKSKKKHPFSHYDDAEKTKYPECRYSILKRKALEILRDKCPEYAKSF